MSKVCTLWSANSHTGEGHRQGGEFQLQGIPVCSYRGPQDPQVATSFPLDKTQAYEEPTSMMVDETQTYEEKVAPMTTSR